MNNMIGQSRIAPASRSPFASAMRLWPVLVLVALALFPFGWLGRLWPTFDTALGWLFPSAWEHAVGHTALFASLGLLALALVPALRTRPWMYLALLLLVGLGQEGFQLLYKQRSPVFDDARDLATDLAGALVAFALVWLWRRRPTTDDRPPTTDRQPPRIEDRR